LGIKTPCLREEEKGRVKRSIALDIVPSGKSTIPLSSSDGLNKYKTKYIILLLYSFAQLIKGQTRAELRPLNVTFAASRKVKVSAKR
jgi:hypothetical protein